MSKGYVQYNGDKVIYSFARNWEPGTQVPVEKICKDFGSRAGDEDCGNTFLSWLMVTMTGKPFSLHLHETVLEESSDSVELSKEGTGGKFTAECGTVTVAATAEEATAQLKSRVIQQGSQIQDTASSDTGFIEVTAPPEARTERSKQRISSVQQVKEAMLQDSAPMTGDMLDTSNEVGTKGGAVSDSFLATPTATTPGTDSQIKVQPNQIFMVNPEPSLNPSNKVSTGRDGIVTNTPPVQDFSNIQPSTRSTDDSQPLTGDDLAAVAPEVQSEEVNSIPAPQASAIGGKSRPAVAGSTPSPSVTLDHIVRAVNSKQAISAVNKCKDRQILNLAKKQLSNSSGTQKLTDKIDSRIKFLRERGM